MCFYFYWWAIKEEVEMWLLLVANIGLLFLGFKCGISSFVLIDWVSTWDDII